MSLSRPILFFFLLLGTAAPGALHAQLGYELDIKKPEPYTERELKAEKSGQKKFTVNRRFFQNLTTHYNYFFNASNKLNEVVTRAKAGHRDDYTQLLPFYNYTLDATASDANQLDSVIYKAQTGIVMHDLRNDWIDDMYLLWGAAYFFRKEYDSAAQIFQFINWAFAEKEADGYFKYIGSRLDGSSAASIATLEDDGLFKRMVSDPPSRNNAFLWQARTFIEQGQADKAATLLQALKLDPHFPERLQTHWNEVQALRFYRQQQWDSAATYLIGALERAQNKAEQARWEFLIAQLLERSGRDSAATEWYPRAMAHTTDPIMEIHARLNLVRIRRSGGEDGIDKNIAELLKMARRDKYTDYRDVIYFMAAQMELERNNTAAAETYLHKGLSYSTPGSANQRQAFLQVAGLAYGRRDYRTAARYYDSLQPDDVPADQVALVDGRKQGLRLLVPHLEVVERQDSLQKLAALPEDERNELINKMVRKMRREQGLNEDESLSAGGNLPVNSTATPDLFRSPAKGEWYFYNDALKLQGETGFRQTWGNRPNVDNWRRFSAVNAGPRNRPADGTVPGLSDPVAVEDELPSFSSLISRIPLNEAQRERSDDSIRASLMSAVQVYMNDLEDLPSAIRTLEELRTRFPDSPQTPEELFALQYAYGRTGRTAEAEAVKKALLEQYGDTREALIVQTGRDPNVRAASPEATRDYEGVYDLYLEGRFDEAKRAKQRADSVYQTNYWQPQLLYIEAVYHIRQREDSTAQGILQTLINQDPEAPLSRKAAHMLEVLARRKQIEDELNALQIERPAEDEQSIVRWPTQQQPQPVRDTVQAVVTAPPPQVEKQVVKEEVIVEEPARAVRTGSLERGVRKEATVNAPGPVRDTLARKPLAPAPKIGLYSYIPESEHFAVIILNKVDKVYGTEARNAFDRYNQEKYYNLPLQVQSIDLSDDLKLLVIGGFAHVQSAVDYVQKAKTVAAGQIVPWLKSDKYSFTIISGANLPVLQANPDLERYQKFLDQNLPVKF